MLSKPTYRLIVVALFLLISAISNAQTINTDALNAYWKLTEKAAAGDTISKQEWQFFLNLPGNKQYITNQAFDKVFLENYRRNIQFVYNPQNADKLKKMMEHKFDYWQVYKVNQYKAHEAELKNYAAHLHDAAYMDSMYQNAWAWLPSKLRKRHPSTIMYFIGIDNDAIVQGDTIVFTLWFLRYGLAITRIS